MNAPVLVKSAEGCQAFFLLFFHFFWFRSFRLFPASNAVEKDLNCECDKWRSKETKKTALERELTIAIQEADSSPQEGKSPDAVRALIRRWRLIAFEKRGPAFRYSDFDIRLPS